MLLMRQHEVLHKAGKGGAERFSVSQKKSCIKIKYMNDRKYT